MKVCADHLAVQAVGSISLSIRSIKRMKRIACLALVALLGLTAAAWAGPFACLNAGIHCICPPPPSCPDCSNPCDWRLHLLGRRSEHVHKLIDELASTCC